MVTTLAIDPVRTLPNNRLYFSQLGLFGFQEEGVAKAVVRTEKYGVIAIWDTGTGKTHLSMATAALLYELGCIDQVVVSCERGKLKDWVSDFTKYTALSAALYHGGKRKSMYLNPPQVMVSTYETIKTDCGPREKNKRTGPGGSLTEFLRGKRVFVVYDEITKLKNRKSATYKAHAFLLATLRREGTCRVLGLTATPVERDVEDYFNIMRQVAPDLVGTVEWFEKTFVRHRDVYDRPKFHQDRLPDFVKQISPAVMRKRKTDPDVISQFPRQVEESTHVEMGEQQSQFYEAVSRIFDVPEDQEDLRSDEQIESEDRQLKSVLRLIAAHPASLARANGKLAKQITAEMGEGALRAIGSAKTEAFVERMKQICKGQGDQVVAFTFFGQAVLPLLAEELRTAGLSVAEHHGGQTVTEQNMAQQMFKNEQVQIFLSSDAGARGLNFGNAAYIENYEMPGLYAVYVQRINRVHRIDSVHPSVTANTFIVDNTLEAAIASSSLSRNAIQDLVIDEDATFDLAFIPAQVRRRLLGIR